jgi:hypothetical protein
MRSQKSYFFSGFALLLAAVLSACSGPVNNKETPNIWGSDFTFTPLHEATAEEREIGRAVVLIRRAEGGSGVGFFISSDGLFITNEHVLSKARCSVDRCGGVQLIRNMSPGGDFEVFNQIVLVAANSDPNLNLDFAIGKVIGKNIQVPYLRLAAERKKDSDLSNTKLEFFGHPFGASARVRAAKFLFRVGNTMQFVSPVLPGNSGGPVVNMEDRSVVGLINESLFHVETADRVTGNFGHTLQAIDIVSIRKVLARVFPQTANAAEFNTAMFENPHKDRPDLYRDILPRSRADFLRDEEPTTASYVGQFLGTDREGLGFEKVMSIISNLAGKSEAASRFALNSMLFSFERGTELKDSINIDRVLKLIEDESEAHGREAATALRVLSGSMTTDKCLQNNNDPTNPLTNVYKALYVCVSTKTVDQRSTLQVLMEYLEQHRSEVESNPAQENILLSLIARQMLLEVPTQAQSRQIVDLLKSVENTRYTGIQFEAEGTRTLVEKDPKLISRGAFQNTF